MWTYTPPPAFSELLGKTIASIAGGRGESQMVFTLEGGEQYRLYHQQDCCESVSIEDIAGDLNDLLGSPITMAEESSNSDSPPVDAALPGYVPESFTWTFYKLATIRGYVTIRWLGESNGYYSESVDFEKITDNED